MLSKVFLYLWITYNTHIKTDMLKIKTYYSDMNKVILRNKLHAN